MRKFGLLGTSALGSFTFVGLSMALAAPAYAQDAQSGPGNVPPACSSLPEGTQRDNCLAGEVETESGTNANAATESNDSILVTGSRIRRPNLESTVPITSVGGEEFFQTARVSIGDVLNDLPALASTFSQSNSTRFLGTAGLSLVDLRALGTVRTLVLVNGRRHVGQDVLNNATSVDVNTIPTDLIERVDVVTGGNSAVYGSDAIAGVVNFVLRQNFDGIQLRGQGGVTTYGDGGAYFASILAGHNFADGRGNIAVNAEYARQQTIFADGRNYLQSQDGFVVVDTDPAGLPNGSDGVPDRVYFRDIRSASLSNTGIVRFGGTAATSARQLAAGENCGLDPTGAPYTCNFIFTRGGQLVPQTGNRFGIGPGGSFIGGNGENFRDQGQFQLLPRLDRYNVNLIGHFTISEAFEPFIEAKYARTNTFGAGSSGPAFIQGSTLTAFGGDAAREQVRLDNPFLSNEARAVITQQLTIANGVAPTGATKFSVRENLLGLGIRNEQAQRETYRAVAGVRGQFLGDWSYEVSANYGEFKESTKVLGNLNVQRFLLANDATRNAAGQIVCRSQIDPAARIDLVGNATILANDVAGCVPINIFGGQFTQAQRDYLLADTTSHGKITQFDANAYISGNTGRFFSLPGGPIGFVVGAEYRRETNRYIQDPLVSGGYTFYNALPDFVPPSFAVKEAYGEIRIPILKDMPFFHELTLSGAGRVSKYKGLKKEVYAYNYGVDWAPIQDIRFRANYSRAVRAPNLGELYSPAGQNFAPGFQDPCARDQIGTGTSTRAAACLAAGVPTDFNFRYTSSLLVQSGGNPFLTPETSDSWTIGGVIQPRFAPGLSFTADYYNIRVNNVISSVSAQFIANQCYDLPSGSSFCDLFQRNTTPNTTDASGNVIGHGPSGEIFGQILEGSLIQSSVNFAKLRARGIDFELAYRHQVDGIGRISGRINWTHQLTRENYTTPTDPTFANQVLYTLGVPKERVVANLDLKSGPFTIGGRMRYLGKQVLNAYEDYFEYQGRPPQNADYADRRFYPSVIYLDARLGIDATENFNFYLGIDNLANRRPPLGATGIGGGSGIFDVRGRTLYAGARAKF
jgi:outer membrane receptor protein involved in Fe transport